MTDRETAEATSPFQSSGVLMQQVDAGYYASSWQVSGFVQYAALAYIFSAPLDVIPFPIGSPVTVTGAVFLLSWIVALYMGTVRIPRAPTLLTVLSLVFVWSFATVLWSYAPTVSLIRSLSTLLLVASAVAVASVLPGGTLRAATALAAGSTIAGCWILVSGPEVLESPTGLYVQGQQTTIPGVDENALAFSLSLGMACALFVVLRSRAPGRRLAAIVMVMVLVAALILVGSRTGVGSLIAISAVSVLISFRTTSNAVGAMIAILASAGIVRLIAAAGVVPPRVLEWLQQPVAMDSRMEIVDAYRMTMTEWLMKGVGVGADADYLFASVSWYKNAHSAFWKVWIEQGLIGLILWGLMLVGFVYWAARSTDRTFFLLVLPPVLFFFLTLGPIYNNALWVVFGLALTPASSLGIGTRSGDRGAGSRLGRRASGQNPLTASDLSDHTAGRPSVAQPISRRSNQRGVGPREL